ncbi:hypothetical protein J4E82_000378 [Alternaria postmessia]|uniref:uncharacterized protein n=1 Tax=Alternaria postmessia TaxID=1187938 RepID=UPI002225AB26|nr:uncharacterized protein J4E82_000378 [Alternaria postmessia]KAI5381178.1 hypothetical protein J4E82_000378 [Alternaria postmessia]
MSDPPKSLFGDGGKIIVPMPKGKASVASEPAITGVNTEKRFTLSQPDDKDVKDAAAATNTAKLEGKLASIGIGPNPCYQPASKVFRSHSDKPRNATSCFKFLPNEVVGEIGSELNVRDLNSMRLASMRLNYAVNFQYGKKIMVTENVTIFPTFSSIASFLVGLGLDDAYPATVRTITLVGEAPKTPELSYDISWINLLRAHPDPNRQIVPLTRLNRATLNSSEYIEAQKVRDTDRRIVLSVNDKHEEWDYINKDFCHTGGYRTMLSVMLSKLPNLKTITTRKLHVGEHIPGWEGPEALKHLSYYRPDLPINKVYYGDWQYDTVHKRTTMYTDEYGEYIEEANAGPQAGFKEDVLAAMEMSGTSAMLA